MSILRLVVPAVVIAAALAGCFAYFVTPQPRVEAEEQPTPTLPDVTSSTAATPEIVGQRRTAEDFERAAEAILKRLPDALADASIDNPPIIGRIPLPKRRPIPR
jgi:hypothetical protein